MPIRIEVTDDGMVEVMTSQNQGSTFVVYDNIPRAMRAVRRRLEWEYGEWRMDQPRRADKNKVLTI
jgi:hypothetical protein